MSDDLTPDVEGAAAAGGMDRRTFVRRAAVTGALAWAAPSITSMPAALADNVDRSEICLRAVDTLEVEQTVEANANAAIKTATGQVPGANADILGGQRDVVLTAATGNPGGTRKATASFAGGELGMTISQDTSSILKVTWDGVDGDPNAVDTTNLSEDLTGSGDFDRFALFIDVGAAGGTELFLRIWSGGTSYEVTTGALAAGSQNLQFSFASFGAPALAFTAVQAVQLEIDTPEEVDYVTTTLRICRIN